MEEFFRDYKIDRMIGSGAYGQVYRITREEFGHIYEAALKVIELPKNLSEVEIMYQEGFSEQNVTAYYQSVVRDIVYEVELMAKLKGNSYIVSYEDHKVIEKTDSFGWKIYIQMELLTPLLEHIEKKGMTYYDALHLGINICKALELCQKHKIIHRDIKPENIFVSNNEEYKLGDFGVAKQLERMDSHFSQKGTQNYMAPEIFRGVEYDATVDIYSLGIVLYRYFNDNRMPFLPPLPLPICFSDKEKAMSKRLAGERMLKPSKASERLAEIILKACAFNPDERYKEAKQLRIELERVLSEEEDQVLIEPLQKQKNENKDAFQREEEPKKETETVVLIGASKEENTSQPSLGEFVATEGDASQKTQLDVPTQETEILDGDETIQILEVPQRKNNTWRFVIGGLAGIAAVLICVIFFGANGKRGHSSVIKVTNSPTLVETVKPSPTVKASQRPKETMKPTRKTKKAKKSGEKATSNHTAVPSLHPTTEVSVEPTINPTANSNTDVVTEIPKPTKDGNSQETIDIEPDGEQEIVME